MAKNPSKKPTAAEIAAMESAAQEDNIGLFQAAHRIASRVFGANVGVDAVLGTCELLANQAFMADETLVEGVIRDARTLARTIGFPSAEEGDVMSLCDVLVDSDDLSDAQTKLTEATKIAKEIFSTPDLSDVVSILASSHGMAEARRIADAAGLSFSDQGAVALAEACTSPKFNASGADRAAAEVKKLWGDRATLEGVVALYYTAYSNEDEDEE